MPNNERMKQTVTIEEFRRDPRGVIRRAFDRGEIVVASSESNKRMRFAAQMYDIELECFADAEP